MIKPQFTYCVHFQDVILNPHFLFPLNNSPHNMPRRKKKYNVKHPVKCSVGMKQPKTLSVSEQWGFTRLYGAVFLIKSQYHVRLKLRKIQGSWAIGDTAPSSSRKPNFCLITVVLRQIDMLIDCSILGNLISASNIYFSPPDVCKTFCHEFFLLWTESVYNKFVWAQIY